MIQEYTRRSLTFQHDIFPALSGLAKQMQARRGCKYYAGLREDSLATDMLWAVQDLELYDDEVEISDSFPRPNKWRAPTWSWASTTGPISYAHLGIVWNDTSPQCIDCSRRIFIGNFHVECAP